MLISNCRKNRLIAPRPIAVGTDDTADADGMCCSCAHPDHSGSATAFTPESDLNAQRPQERLRASRARMGNHLKLL
jgi:hypothetical protein